MPHGHAGKCDWVAQSLSDDALRSECERRGGVGYVDPFRGIAEKERDEWKRRAERAEAFVASDESFRNGATKWMKRAKALEDGLAERLGAAIDKAVE